jgi:hypothetical protein
MTLEELKQNWREYGVELPSGEVVPLKERFAICWGSFQDGLLFDPGGEQGAEGAILKTDEEDNCYLYTYPEGEEEGRWTIQGRFVRLEEEG